MLEEEQEREHPPKETLYIRNVNERIKPKGSAFSIQI